MAKRIYNMKKTISMRQFIVEFGENFTEHMKVKLSELGERCVLTRKDEHNRLDLKHIEHTQHESACDGEGSDSTCLKEYSYGQFVVEGEALYFSEKCHETAAVIKSPKVSYIYNALNSEVITTEDESCAKKIDDSNIDFVIDSILSVCPEVSQRHLDIVKEMLSYRER